MKNTWGYTWVEVGITGFLIWLKKSNCLAFFPTQICAICYSRTFFWALSTCYIRYFLNSILSLTSTFFPTKNICNTKIIIIFEGCQILSNFLFLVTYVSFNPVCAREDAAPSQFFNNDFWLSSYFQKVYDVLIKDVLISWFNDLLVNNLTI